MGAPGTVLGGERDGGGPAPGARPRCAREGAAPRSVLGWPRAEGVATTKAPRWHRGGALAGGARQRWGRRVGPGGSAGGALAPREAVGPRRERGPEAQVVSGGILGVPRVELVGPATEHSGGARGTGRAHGPGCGRTHLLGGRHLRAPAPGRERASVGVGAGAHHGGESESGGRGSSHGEPRAAAPRGPASVRTCRPPSRPLLLGTALPPGTNRPPPRVCSTEEEGKPHLVFRELGGHGKAGQARGNSFPTMISSETRSLRPLHSGNAGPHPASPPASWPGAPGPGPPKLGVYGYFWGRRCGFPRHC